MPFSPGPARGDYRRVVKTGFSQRDFGQTTEEVDSIQTSARIYRQFLRKQAQNACFQ